MKEVLIIIPAYNEEDSIGALLDQLTSHEVQSFADVLVVNDASADQTGFISKKYGVATVSHIFNLGYGSALQLGYKYAVRRNYKYVIQLDADGQHDVSNVAAIYNRLQQKDAGGSQPDIVIGSRFMEGSMSFPLSGIKKIAMGFFRWVIRRAAKKRILDPTSGLQGLNRRAFLYYSQFQNFNFNYPDANMLIQMLLLGYQVVEIPAIMHERRSGVSMHAGFWRPFFYMLIMPLSIIGVYLRIKSGFQKPVGLKSSAGIELGKSRETGGPWTC